MRFRERGLELGHPLAGVGVDELGRQGGVAGCPVDYEVLAFAHDLRLAKRAARGARLAHPGKVVAGYWPGPRTRLERAVPVQAMGKAAVLPAGT